MAAPPRPGILFVWFFSISLRGQDREMRTREEQKANSWAREAKMWACKRNASIEAASETMFNVSVLEPFAYAARQHAMELATLATVTAKEASREVAVKWRLAIHEWIDTARELKQLEPPCLKSTIAEITEFAADCTAEAANATAAQAAAAEPIWKEEVEASWLYAAAEWREAAKPAPQDIDIDPATPKPREESPERAILKDGDIDERGKKIQSGRRASS